MLHWLDFAVIGAMFLLTFGVAAYYSRKAGKDTDEFFLSGRNLPWYVAGTAMVATTFAADTPLAVTELVARNGIAGNWLWWNMAIGAMLTVFFFARLWRRAGIMTDVELVELRYSGRVAAVLRGLRAVYLGLLMNAIVLAWVHTALQSIFQVVLPGLDSFLLVAAVAALVAIYAAASGLVGTSRTDALQFVIAMIGCIVLAVVVVQLPEVGGAANFKNILSIDVLSFVPRIGDAGAGGVAAGVLALTVGSFVAYVGVQWWSSWYPGADPGGGGYIAQRMMAAKDERHSFYATLWFTVAHYTVRPWPWILVALGALVVLPRAESVDVLREENPVLFPQVEMAYANKALLSSGDPVYRSAEFLNFYEKYENTVAPRLLYPKMMLRFLPPGLLGLLIAVFLAAYMSTIASQLNWGTSYLINDFYRRFIRRSASDRHYVLVSRISIAVVLIFSLLIARYVLTSIAGAWEFIINASAGMGAVLVLRWFWWRVNAWTEIAALVTPLVVYPIALASGLESPITLYPTVLGTTIVWLAVTFLTKPVDRAVLHAFYRRVHPGGIGWKAIAAELPDVKSDSGFGRLAVGWVSGVVVVYMALFGMGKLLLGEYAMGGLFAVVGVVAVLVMSRSIGGDSRK
jgi:Na+/proline symporter